MHDYIIISYSVDIKNKTVELCAQDRNQTKESRFIAQHVLTHSFKNILEYNIISDIEEWGVDYFIKNDVVSIEGMRQNFWPLEFEDMQQLRDFIVDNGYKYIRISCSYGLQGWVLAKEFKII